MKYYFQALYKSFTDPTWLARQSREAGKSSVFFVLTLLVLSLLVAVRIAYIEIPQAVPPLREMLDRELPDFTAHVSDGTLSVTDLEQPYVRYFEYEGEHMVIVVDTTTNTPSLDTFLTTSTQTGFLITSRAVVTKTSSTPEVVNDRLTRFPDTTISKNQLITFLDTLGGRGQLVVLLIITAFTFLLWSVGLLVFILIFTSIAYGLYSAVSSHDRGARYTWKEILTLSLFVFGLPKLVITIVTVVFPVSSFAFVVSGAMGIALGRALGIPKKIEHQKGSDTTLSV